MTPQEQRMIDELVDRIRNTPVANKDVEAERHLQQTLGSVPDALYILAQTVLVQQYGLSQAQAQLQARQEELDELRQQSSQTSATARSGGSFLSRIFGSDQETPAQGTSTQSTGSQNASASGYQPVNYGSPTQSYPPPPQGGQYGGPAYGGPGYGTPGNAPYGQPGYGGPGYGMPAGGSSFGMPGGFGGGGGGFLRGALQTAAGVAAGAMVFRGMEDLFSGFGGHESHGLVGGAGESVVNNYYSDADRNEGSRDDSSFYNPAHDASRENLGDGSDSTSETRGFGALDEGSDSDPNDSTDNFAEDDNFNDSDDNSSFDDSGFDSGDSGDQNS